MINMPEVSAGIVFSNGRILCTQKGTAKYDYLSDKYEFPGGKIESGETPKECLIREFKEELSAQISDDSLTEFAEYEYNYPDFKVKLHFFVIRSNDFQFKLTEHKNYLWLPLDRLSTIDWVAADSEIIPKLKEYLAERCVI